MAKDAITDYSATAGSNTDVGGVNIAENCPAAGLNNAAREMMSHLADMNAGTAPLHDTVSLADPADLTKIARFDVGSITTSTTRVVTIPDFNLTLVGTDATQTLTNKTINAPTITGTVTAPDNSIPAAAIDNMGRWDVILNDSKTSGTSGGSFASGSWATRTLNTEHYDPDGLCTLSSNTFTFTKDGIIEWSAPGYACGQHQTRVYNVTDAVALEVGTSEFSPAGIGATPQTRSIGVATVVASKVYRLEHQCQTTQADGFGVAGSFTTELYSQVKFRAT